MTYFADPNCEHQDWEREASLYTEGYCPPCMVKRITSLEEALRTLGAVLDDSGNNRHAIPNDKQWIAEQADRIKSLEECVRELIASDELFLTMLIANAGLVYSVEKEKIDESAAIRHDNAIAKARALVGEK